MNLGRSLILLGILLIAAGIFVTLSSRLPFRLGHLPGDIVIRGKNSTFYFPLATCVLLSVALSIVMWLLSKRG